MTLEELANQCRAYAWVRVTEFGMDVDEESRAAKVADDAAARILAAGGKYRVSETVQGFERLTIGAMLVGLREELLDAINYATMIDILAARAEASDPEDITPTFAVRADMASMAGFAVLATVRVDRLLEDLQKSGREGPQSGDFAAQLVAAEVPAHD